MTSLVVCAGREREDLLADGHGTLGRACLLAHLDELLRVVSWVLRAGQRLVHDSTCIK